MRLFETLLLLPLLPSLTCSLYQRNRSRWSLLLVTAAVTLALIHLIVEKYRWQMVPAYLLTGLLLLLEKGRWQNTVVLAGRRWSGILIHLLGLAVWLVSFALPSLLPVPELLPPTGPYAIGTAVYHLIDLDRDEFYTEVPGDKREMMVQLWYPGKVTPGARRATYIDRLDIAAPAFAAWQGLPSFLLDHINLTKVAGSYDLEVSGSSLPFPVIIFSHGLHSFRAQNTSLFQELASHGYVVVAIDHTYANLISVFPDGRVTFYNPGIFSSAGRQPPRNGHTLVGVWAGDIGFLLDEMTRWSETPGHLFDGRLDLSRIGVIGHSTGGGTALEFCQRDLRCQAGIALDGWVEPVSDALLTSGATQPFMFINTPAWLGPENRARGRSIFNALDRAGYLLAIANTGHYDFSDLTLLSPLTPQLGLTGTIDGPYSVGLQNAYIKAFFDRYLIGMDTPLLAGEAIYPEVQFESNGLD